MNEEPGRRGTRRRSPVALGALLLAAASAAALLAGAAGRLRDAADRSR
jgi:hypothetical protein